MEVELSQRPREGDFALTAAERRGNEKYICKWSNSSGKIIANRLTSFSAALAAPLSVSESQELMFFWKGITW